MTKPCPQPHLHGWGIHEVKGDEVVDAHGLEGEDGGGQVGALDLRDGRGEHLVTIRSLGVETVALAGSRATCSTRTLLGLGLQGQ